MQLENVIKSSDIKEIIEISNNFNIEDSKRFKKHSLLSSIITNPNLPRTLLREHYRCHPKIINFCNLKFYNNELIILTKDHNETDVLRVIKTVEGNHARGNLNVREVDVIMNEAIPLLCTEKTNLQILV